MLAFNLGVFFKNLSGAPVFFSAKGPTAEVTFVGTVTDLQQESGWQGSITVTLRQGALACTIVFDEAEEEQHPEASGVQVSLLCDDATAEESEPLQLLTAGFRFKDVTLHPVEPLTEPEPPRSA